MDLIYADKNRIECGVIQNFEIDFDTTSAKDFQITVGINNNVLQGGFWWYIEGTEYGGRVDEYEILSETNEIVYTGRNFRGILTKKIIEPPSGEDYKIVSGSMQDVISGLLADASLQDIFIADESDIVVSNHKFNRYATLYDGICALATRYNVVPTFLVQDGKVNISFHPPTDYSDENEFTQDDLQFSIKKTFANVNHLICLGKGDLKDRTVIHLYSDKNGNVSERQTLFGIDEIVEVYENTNAEDEEVLKTEGSEKLNELKNTDSFQVTVPDITLKIGDIIGGMERVTGTYVAREIVNIIAKISDSNVELEYKVGEDDTTSKSSGGSSGSTDVAVVNLLPASTKNLGGVIIGDNIDVDASGKISVTLTKGEKGDAGADGQDGADGKDGVSVSSIIQTTTSTEDGGTNVITATLSDGTKTTFNVKNGSKGSKGDTGEKGDDGKDGQDGADGKDGVSVSSIIQTTTSTEDGGTNVITATLSNGTKTTFNVKNGSKGTASDDTTLDSLTDKLGAWEYIQTEFAGTFRGVAYGKGRVVVVGNNGAVYYSDDASTWTYVNGIDAYLYGIAYGKGRFVAVGTYEGAVIKYSDDGITWKSGSGASGILYGVAYGNGTFVAVGTGGMYYSTDAGTTWNACSGSTSTNLNAIAYGNGMFVAVGSNGAVYYSIDGIEWTNNFLSSSFSLNGIAYGDGMFVTGGTKGYGIYYSTDGIEWNSSSNINSSFTIRGITYGNGVFVAVGDVSLIGGICYSTDGITWTDADTEVSTGMLGVGYGKGIFVSAGYDGMVYTCEFLKESKLVEDFVNEINAKVSFDETIINSLRNYIDELNNNFKVGAKQNITFVENSSYCLNGTNGTHYYYYTIGKLAFVQINVYCVATVTYTMQTIGTGVPKAKYENTCFALGSQLGADSMMAGITTSGDVQVVGGTPGGWYYGLCIYPIA